MPIYEYLCKSCAHRFEVRQNFSDDALTECTECGAPVRRVLHPAGVIFKGSGWYINDSRKSESKASNNDGGGGESGDSGTDDKTKAPKDATSSESTSTESKPVDSKKVPAATAASD